MKSERLVRLQIMLSPVEMSAIEQWRFTVHMPSRASAVREILRRGLVAEGFKLANVGANSESYGVVATPVPDDV